MFVRASKLMFGVLASSLVVGAAGTALAHPWQCPQPYPYYHHYHHYGPIVYASPAPVYAVNPAPAAIQLVNPNQVALNYTLDGGAVQALPAGSSVAINQDSVIAFDRGGAMGWNRYTLSSGVYKFIPAAGAWSLVRDVPISPIVAAANPLPPSTP